MTGAKNLLGCRLAARLEEIDPGAVEVVSIDRYIPRKEQARLARRLFRDLELKGISVTTPSYSMAQAVDVRLPHRSGVMERKVRAILSKAFPNHDDRSDSRTDHFDYCWSIDS